LDELGQKPNDILRISDKIRLSGNITLDMILEAEIKRGHTSPDRYEKLLRESKIDRNRLKRLTEAAIIHHNTAAIEGFLKVNRVLVSEMIQNDEAVKLLDRRATNEKSNAPEIYFLVRNYLDPKFKKIYQRLARSAILNLSLRIAAKWIKGEEEKKTIYQLGMEFDIEDTLEIYIEKIFNINYDDIIGITREKKRKTGIVIIDTSGSMHYEKIINAALAACVLAYTMREDDYSIITFNTKAAILTKFKDKKNTEKIVDQILETEPIGYTNISAALILGLKELSTIKKRDKWGILITDGNYNRGGDPRQWALKYPKLHVIAIPSHKEKWGIRVCKDLAKKGRGRFMKVSRYSEIPRILARMLRDI